MGTAKKATLEETWGMIHELAREVKESQKETERVLRESLVKRGLIRLLNDRNIEVTKIAKEHECLVNGKKYEFDIIADNGNETVVVEVKTTLKQDDVNHFLGKLRDFKEVFPKYQTTRFSVPSPILKRTRVQQSSRKKTVSLSSGRRAIVLPLSIKRDLLQNPFENG